MFQAIDVYSVLILLLCALIGFIWFFSRSWNYWARKGVPHVPPLPIFGNSISTAFGLIPTCAWQVSMYNRFKGNRFFGTYSFMSPTFFVRDPDLVESVIIKDFSHFYNRGTNVDTKLDPLSAHLVNLEDGKWKSLRNKLTPTFSTGKLKGMIPQVQECTQGLVDLVNSYETNSEVFELRELMARFTTDVISSCAFGLTTNSLKDVNSVFRRLGKRVFQPSLLSKLRGSLRGGFPAVINWLKWKSLPVKLENFFVNVVKETIEHREKNGVQRNDFLQLLMELKKNDEHLEHQEHELKIDDKIVAANAFVFFLAGFETTASTLSYCLFELSKDEHLQERLYLEMTKALEGKGAENISYETLKNMHLLDRIIAETLRMYPPVPATSRVANMPYQVPGTTLVLDKGTRVNIPIHALQHDPNYYPSPETFDPDRFGEIYTPKKGTYLPFGDGPRICIGMRFAQMEIKIALTMLLLNFKFKVNSKTLIPLQYHAQSIFLVPKGGLWVNAVRRK